MLLHPDAPHDEPLLPSTLWSAWELDPLIVVPLAVTALLYARGVRALWASAGVGRGVTRGAVAAFWAGWLTLVVALVSPLHPLGSVLFSAHMTQHELLMVLAAPLLVLGRPLVPLLWALPPGWRRGLGAASKRSWIATPWRWLVAPMTAWWVHAVALWVWHLPGPYQATLRSDAVHTLQHASFFGTAVLFWWALLTARRVGRGAAVAYLFAAMLATGVLGALITFSSALWYPVYAETTVPWGLTPLEDQQLGGMIMWMPGGLTYMLAALWLFAGWLHEPTRPGRVPVAPVEAADVRG